MERFTLNEISSKESNLFVKILEKDNERLGLFLKEIGNNGINIISISITGQKTKTVILIIDDINKNLIENILIKFRYPTENNLRSFSSFSIKGTQIRGEGGHVKRILDNLSDKDINLELLNSSALSYEFYIKKKYFSEGFKLLLNSLGLPHMHFK